MNGKVELLKSIYLYIFSAIGLILIVIGSVKLLDLGLKIFVFKNADVYYWDVNYPNYPERENVSQDELQKQIEKQKELQKLSLRAEREKQISNSLAMIVVGLPLFLYHWRKILKQK